MRVQLLPKRRANVNPQGEQSGSILETIAGVNLKQYMQLYEGGELAQKTVMLYKVLLFMTMTLISE